MESFEHVVKVWLEAQGYAVSTNVKFFMSRRTRKQSHQEVQEHGYEVDVVAARHDELLLASVKSYFGSRGVHPGSFPALEWHTKPTYRGGVAMFTDPEIQEAIVAGASDRYGYPREKIHLALVAGRFHYKDGRGEAAIRRHLGGMKVGGGPIRVHNVDEIAGGLIDAITERDTYLDDPVVTTLRMLREANAL